jgi:hypothetical protein
MKQRLNEGERAGMASFLLNSHPVEGTHDAMCRPPSLSTSPCALRRTPAPSLALGGDKVFNSRPLKNAGQHICLLGASCRLVASSADHQYHDNREQVGPVLLNEAEGRRGSSGHVVKGEKVGRVSTARCRQLASAKGRDEPLLGGRGNDLAILANDDRLACCRSFGGTELHAVDVTASICRGEKSEKG